MTKLPVTIESAAWSIRMEPWHAEGLPTGPTCQLDAPIPPQNGEFVVSYYPARHVGYPVVQTGVRAAWTAIQGGGVGLRVTGGVERAWARGL